MKRITFYLVAFFLVAFSWQGMAQLTQDFEVDPPASWTFQSTEADDPGFVITTSHPHGGSSSFYHNDDNISTESTSYMVSPAYTVQAGDELAFWYYQNYSGSYYVYSGAWISTASNDPIANPADFTELIEFGDDTSANNSEDAWTEFRTALTAYEGQTVYVAFKYTGDYNDEVFIDDFSISNPPAYAPVATLAELRAGTVGEKYEFTGEGFATMARLSASGDGSIRVWGQDSTAGMQFYAASGVISATSINFGDGVTGVKGLLTEAYGNLVFVVEEDITLTGNNQPIIPEEITAQNYVDNREDYESELIKINNATIDPNGDASFVQYNEYALTDDSGGNVTLAVIFPQLDGTIPTFANVTGLAGEKNGVAGIAPRGDTDVEAVTCSLPIDLVVSNISDLSASLGWTAGVMSDTIWDVEWGTVGFTPGTGAEFGSAIDTTDNPFIATGLMASTDYEFYVRTSCDAGEGDWVGPVAFTTLATPPVNDTMAGAIPITPSPEGTVCDASSEFTAHLAGDGTTDSGMDGTCNGTNTGLDVFYTWTATSDALVWNDGDGNPGIVIRDAAGTEIICEGTYASDDIELSGWAINDDLIIQIYDYNTSDVDVTFCLAEKMLPPPPANDDACNAEILTLNAAPTVGTNIGATGQTDEPVSSCRADATVNSVWYTFVSTGEDTVVSTDFVTELHDTYITIYSATDCTDFTTFTEVGCDDDGGTGVTSFIQLSGLTAGDTYYVKVDGYSANVGEFNIQVATNDIMAGAIPIVPSPEGTACDADAATFTAHLAGDGTTDSGMDGSCNGTSTGLDRFFSWTATSIGLVWNDGNAGNPGIVIRDTDGNEITCEGTFASDDVILSGWEIGDDLIIQIYDYNDADVDVTFCLAEISVFNPEITATPMGVDCSVDASFNVDVDVTTLGGASAVTVSDDQASATQNATATGVLTFGPYAPGTVVTFTVTSDDDASYTSSSDAVTYVCPPVNDNICDAIALTVGDTSAGDAYTNAGATAEAGEPEGDCFNNGIGGSVWFTFVAPASGAVNVTTDIAGGTNTDTEIAVYAAPTDCADATTFDEALGCDQDGGNVVDYNSIVFVSSLVPGDTYYVQVDNWSGSFEGGTFGIEVQEVTVYNPVFTTTITPDCANAQFSVDVEVTNLGGASTVTVTDGTTDNANVGLGVITYGPYAAGTSVDFTVTNDDDATYLATQTVNYSCPPANDNICDAIALTMDATSASDAYTNAGATAEAGEPEGDCFNNGIGGSVWFTFVAPASGTVNVSTNIVGGTNDDTEIAIYEAPTDCADASTMGTLLGCGQDTSANYLSEVILNSLTPGDTYYVQVDNWSASFEGGTFGIEVHEITVSVPDCPTLVSPVDGATDVFSPVTLDWDAATTGDPADSYNLYISVNGGAEFLFDNYTDTQAPPLGIQPGITVVWRVVPVNAAGENTTCTTSFTMSSVSETGDYDGDGINNIDEYDAGSDYTLPCDPAQAAGYTGYDATNAIWMAADCDGDGQTNDYEATNGSDPYDAASTASLEELAAVGFEFYPNPVNNNLTVKANENITSVAIFNMLGQQVKQVNPSSLNAQIDMTNLANGTYFIKATVGEKVGTFKIVKK